MLVTQKEVKPFRDPPIRIEGTKKSNELNGVHITDFFFNVCCMAKG